MNQARYTLKFKLAAVRLVCVSQNNAAVAAAVGLADQPLHNWLKANREGRLSGSGAKPIIPEQMELTRLLAELAKIKMELEIIKKAAAHFAKHSS